MQRCVIIFPRLKVSCPGLTLVNKHVDEFVHKMARAEKDESKRRKLKALKLTEEEWERADKFAQLLAVCTFEYSHKLRDGH